MATFEHTFTWIGEGATVIATGTFDDWKSSLPLTKGEDDKLSASTQLPYGQKILYKYVVDGNWQHNPNEAHEADESGNMNNVFTAPEKAPEVETVVEAPVAIVAVPIVETAALQEPAKVEEVAVVVVDASVVAEAAGVEAPVVAEEPAKVDEPVSVVEEPVKAAMSYASAATAGASVAAAAIVASVTAAVKHDGTCEDVATKDVDAAPTTAVTSDATPADDILVPSAETATPVAEAAKLEEKKDDSYLGAATAGLGAIAAGASVAAGKALEAGHEAKVKALAVAEEARVAAHEASLAAHALAEEKKVEALKQAEVLKAQAVAYQAQAVEATTKAVESGKAAIAETPFGASALKALGLQDETSVVTPAPTTRVVLNEPSANTTPNVVIPLSAPDNNVVISNGTASPLPVVAPAVVEPSPATPPKDSKKFGTLGRRNPSVSASAAAGADGETVPVQTRKPSFFQKLFGKK